MNVDVSIDMYEYVLNDAVTYAICRLKRNRYTEHFRHSKLRIELFIGYGKNSDNPKTMVYELSEVEPVIEVETIAIPISTFTKETINERSKRFLHSEDLKELEKGKKLGVYVSCTYVTDIAKILKILNGSSVNNDFAELISAVKIYGCKTEIAPIVLVLKENLRFFGILAPSIIIM